MGQKQEDIKTLKKVLNFPVFCLKVILSIFKRNKGIKSNGTHFIAGLPGSGKTLLVNSIINEFDKEKYFFLSNLKEFNQENVYSFKMTDIFSDNTQIKSFPLIDHKGRKLGGIIFDEINLHFNKRLNRKGEYNDIFVGLIEFLVSHRHQGVPRLYFIGQKLELQDTQLVSLFKYYHDIVRTKRVPKYWHYLANHKVVVWLPFKIKYLTYTKDINDEFKLIKERPFVKKIRKRDLLSYDTKALGKLYKDLPKIKYNL